MHIIINLLRVFDAKKRYSTYIVFSNISATGCCMKKLAFLYKFLKLYKIQNMLALLIEKRFLLEPKEKCISDKYEKCVNDFKKHNYKTIGDS